MSDKPYPSGRAHFATRLGVIATTVGSAVGLGNIWRFPYEAGNNGGGAFLLLYIVFILILGIPVLCSEFILGREGRSNILGSFRKLEKKGYWHLTGYIGILASLMILSFYSVVAGWTLEYFYQSIIGNLTSSQGELHARFGEFVSGWRPVMLTLLFLLLNYTIIRRDIRKGIEKMSNILTPVLFAILVIFCIHSLMMPGAREGLSFLFAPDFSKVTPMTVLNALGQAFFSLSLGLGCMLTYASYFKDNTKIIQSAGIIAGLDTLVAILAGIMIFPAIFTYGISPSEGPTLVFEVLPAIFEKAPLGSVWSSAFFLMLAIASLTSTISMSEISTAFFCEQFKISRRKAGNISTGICIVGGLLCAMSFGILPVDIFGFFNNVSSNLLLPTGGILISIFTGWIIDRKIIDKQLTNDGALKPIVLKSVVFMMRYVAPPALFVILLMGLF